MIVIRWAETENTLRSTGEPAGVLVFAFPDGHPSWAIDRGWEPHTAPPDMTRVDMFEEGISPLAEAFTIEEIVEACFSREELKHLWLLFVQTFHAGIQIQLGAQAFPAMRELVEFAEDLAAAINTRLERDSS